MVSGKGGFGQRLKAAGGVVPKAASAPEDGRPPRFELGADFEKKAIEEARATGTIISIPKEWIEPDPNQPRTFFNEASLAELGESLSQHGQIEPILVRQLGPQSYQLIVGERRWRAASGRPEIRTLDAVVRNDLDELMVLVLQVTENDQRESMTALDTARAFKRLTDLTGSQKACASIVKRAESTVSVYLQLLEAPESVQQLSDQIQDVTTLDFIRRLVKASPEDGEAVIEGLRSGTIFEGGARQFAKTKLAETKNKKPKPKAKKAAAKLAIELIATSATWVHGDVEEKRLRIQTGTGIYEIVLPKGFK